MIKSFDCVDMKHKAGRKIAQKLAKKTSQQQLDYWNNRHQELVELQVALKKNKSSRLKVLK
ncbi:MAG: hypothetical protein HQL15_09625 [Candidatus Omnitrophica bacterium]|nr:hypothetical protein [Candidatus Omnitrophota bacterium]